MKVDKAVCTNDTINDLQNTIRYETILSTLVEKKILAIKRECEENEKKLKRQRKQKCFSTLIFGKRDCTKGDDNERQNKAIATTSTNEVDDKLNTHNSSLWSHENVINENVAGDSDREKTEMASGGAADDKSNNATSVLNKEKIIGNHIVGIVESHSVGHQCDLRVMDERIHSDNLSSSRQHNNVAQMDCETEKDNTNEMSNHSKSITVHTDYDTGNATNAKSPSLTSHGDNSDDGISSKQLPNANRKYSADTISFPSSSKHTTFSAPIEIPYDPECRHRLRVLEAKSISAQCSPIFTRQIFENVPLPTKRTDCAINTGGVLKSTIPQRLYSRQNTSDDSVNVTFSSVLINDDGIDHIDGDDLSAIHTEFDSTMKSSCKKFLKKKDKLGRSFTKNMAIAKNSDLHSHGFISSFNQLTSNALPVITTTKLKNINNCSDPNRIQHFMPTTMIEPIIMRESTEQLDGRKMSFSVKSSDEREISIADQDLIKIDKRKYSKCWPNIQFRK